MLTMTSPKLILLVLISLLNCLQCKSQDFNVIIVGAGASGIAAATRLLEYGVSNIVIFEAEDRYGGRINSVRFGDNFIDLGAEWVHGETGNVVYEKASKYGILKSTNFTFQYVSSNGRVIEQELEDAFNNFTDYFLEHSETPVEDNESVEQIFFRSYEKFLDAYKNDSKKLKLCVEVIPTIEGELKSLEGSFRLDNVLANTYFEECEGDQNLNWDGLGYKTMLEILMRQYPQNTRSLPVNEKLFVNKPVTKIEYRGYYNQAKVFCKDRSNYTADHVIFTPSLGVLQSMYHTMFSPPLPLDKQRAINELRFEAVMKIAMRFKDAWWADDFRPTSLLWTGEDRANSATDFPFGPVDEEGESWLCSITSILPAENNPKVLIAWVTGSIIPSLEITDDVIIRKGMIYMLNKFFGREYNVGEPEEIIRSEWYTNENFLGTYSHIPVGLNLTEFAPHEALATPLTEDGRKPLVLFAGEATNSKHYSTVHGAIETGYREADRILQYHNML